MTADPQAVCAWCGRAIALAERPSTLDGDEWYCSRECDEAADDQ
jgi:predicted nucleic acid-binding Zn ribbon protein